MAEYLSEYVVDLAMPPWLRPVPHQFAMGDNNAYTFTALLCDSRNPEADLMAGTVSGNLVRPDGETVALEGVKGDAVRQVNLDAGGVCNATPCSVTLPQACFAYPGRVTLTIKLTDGSTITQALAVSAVVARTSTDVVVDPGEVIPDIGAIQAAAAEALDAADDARAAAASAVRYDQSQTLTDTQKGTARTNISAPSVADLTLQNAITAPYPLSGWGADATKTISGVTMTKTGNRVTINGTKSTTSYNITFTNGIKSVSGSDVRNDTLINTDAVLLANHTYRITFRAVSGSYTMGASAYVYFRLYTKTGNGSVERVNFPYGSSITAPVTYELIRTVSADTAIGLGMYAKASSGSFSSLVIEYNVEDITDHTRTIALANQETPLAGADHAAGELIMYSGRLFKVIAPITAGDTLTNGTNIRQVSAYHAFTGTFTSEDIVQGGFTTAEGINANANRVRLPGPVFVTAGTRVLFDIASGLQWDVWELSSSATTGGNVQVTSNWSEATEYTVRHDCWMMVAFKKTTGDIVPADLGASSFRFFLNGEKSASVYDAIPFYDSELLSKGREFSALMRTAGSAVDSFLFFTDSHVLGEDGWMTTMRDAMIKMGSAYDQNPVDFALFGGDVTSGDSDISGSFTADQGMHFLCWQDQLARSVFSRYYAMIGNHDYNYQSGNLLTTQQIVNAMCRPEHAGYYAITGNNATFYVLNTGRNQVDGNYDLPMGEFRWSQITWLGQRLAADNPAHAAVCMHIIRNNKPTETLPTVRMFRHAAAIAAAYNAHTTVTITSETGDEAYSETFDFTGCTGKIGFFLGGHLHGDGQNFITDDGIPCIMRANMTHGGIIPTFDLVLCDWDNDKLYFKRFGDGSDLTVDMA